jgi:gluconokinase
MIIVLMGPAGAGKTTVGRALGAAAGWPFYDADDLHPSANVVKIRRGMPLDDEDREPWLVRVRQLLEEVTRKDGDAVLACSALRERYRTHLGDGLPGVRFVMLDADREVLERRIAGREGHFAGTAILDRQLADLEKPRHALTLSADRPVAVLVREICAAFGLSCEEGPDASGGRGADTK